MDPRLQYEHIKEQKKIPDSKWETLHFLSQFKATFLEVDFFRGLVKQRFCKVTFFTIATENATFFEVDFFSKTMGQNQTNL